MNEAHFFTLFNCELEELDKQSLQAEYRVQKWLHKRLHQLYDKLSYESKIKKPSRIREDKIDFLDSFLKTHKGFLNELEETLSLAEMTRKQRYEERRRKPAKKQKSASMDRDGVQLAWDKSKFMLVARDRGYFTNISTIVAISEELCLDKETVNVLLRNGKFTWGQVMCLGALLEMTPREFCDIFLSGYFVECCGQFVASYDNLDKSVLLERATTLSRKKLEQLDKQVKI